LFTLVPLTVMFAVGYYQARSAVGVEWILWAGVAVAGALFFPAALIRVFLPHPQRPFLIYVAIQVVLALLVVLGATVAAAKGVDFRFAIAMIPTCGLLFSGSQVLEDGNIVRVLIGTGLITAASFCFLLSKMREPWRKIHTLEKAAAALSSAPTIDAAERATTN
jgi:hypothetical protein